MSQGERKALKELSRDKNIVIKTSNKGTTTVLMNRTDKLNEAQVQIDDIHNYRPLDNPMVGTTAKKVHRLIQSLLQEGHIDDIPVYTSEYQYFTHLQRFTNRHLLVDLSYQGVTAVQKESQLLLTTSFSQ